ncbi:Hypothetical predicted protein [Marmota monax]|uniref:Interleukin-3 n=1 Tax=Marmota monax TaxID=9995 RepID=A0A5E4B531_MARMO|nr:hypothetical protein GHT09_005575 [Marmota monax]VTJ64475.1 Hypothetical predicted protein [Marmota monax]
MHPASPNMSSLSTLLLLLFLFCSGLRANNGQPLIKDCNTVIQEIRRNLENSGPLRLFLKTCLSNEEPTVAPMTTPTRKPIVIRKGNLDDFRKKLQYYLYILEESWIQH